MRRFIAVAATAVAVAATACGGGKPSTTQQFRNGCRAADHAYDDPRQSNIDRTFRAFPNLLDVAHVPDDFSAAYDALLTADEEEKRFQPATPSTLLSERDRRRFGPITDALLQMLNACRAHGWLAP